MGGVLSDLRTWLERPEIRRVFKIAGLGFVAFGAIWSVITLDLTWSKLSPQLLLLNLILLAPANFIVAALSLRINAVALGREISNGKSLYTVAVANVAELLPVPGGALVRGAALVNAGARVGESARIVALTSILTLLMTLCLSLSALAILAAPVWGWLAVASSAGLVVLLVLLVRITGASHVIAMILIRIVMLTLTLVRLSVAFATFGVSIDWIEAALYVVAPTLGAAVAIVPAGLGVNEAIAAGLATLISASSASAFLAVTLNRVLGLCAGGILVFAMSFLSGTGKE